MMNRVNERTLKMLAGAVGGVLAGAMGFGLVGCKEEPPPPPPPRVQTPPPPAPEPVSFASIVDELNLEREESIDARVQFAEGLDVTDEGFARGTVLLADALARGDDAAMEELLTRSAQGVLEMLLMDGRWEEGVGGIEAVRVVYAGPYTGEVITEAVSTFGGEELEGFEGLEEMMEGMGEAIAQMMGDAVKNMSPDELQQMRDEAAAAGATEEELKQLDDFIAKVESGEEIDLGDIMEEDEVAQTFGGEHGVLLAIQEPNASYLLGWAGQDAGGSWLFTNVPSSGQLRARASDWDGIGDAGFQYEVALLPSIDPEAIDLDDLEAPDSGDAGGGEEEERNPRRRNTPAGPIDVPGGSAD